MTMTLTLVIYSAILTWLTILVASLIRSKGWTIAGTMIAMGNRDNLPEATTFAGRAERTARNTVGIVYLRTVIWVVSIIGLVKMITAMI